ncbi:MAG: DUF4175 domain-containing protein [Lentisphaerae bacterium]|nr:DUF4175 domain-containing protein [Lentisphaerota bacterium]
MESPDGVRALLEKTALRVKAAMLAREICAWMALCLGGWLGLFALDNLVRLPGALRLALLTLGAGGSAAGLFLRTVRLARTPFAAEGIAVLAERRLGVADNALINACQAEGRAKPGIEGDFVDWTLSRARTRMSGLRPDLLVDFRRVRGWAWAALAAMAAWAAYGLLEPKYAFNAFQRYLRPLSDIPAAGHVSLEMTPCEDVTVLEGAGLEILLRVSGEAEDGRGMPGPEIIWRDGSSLPEGDSGAARALMQPCRNGAAFCHKFDSIRRPLVFRASAAGVLTRAVRVRVRAVPALRGALFRVEPPAYAGEPAATNPGPPAGLSCLAGSRVELRFRSEPPARSATWLLPDGPAQCTNEQGEWRAEWTAVRGGAYSVLLAEAESGGVVTCAAARVALIADAPPEVEFDTDDRNRVYNPGDTVELPIRASDRFGVRRILVRARAQAGTNVLGAVREWNYIGPPGVRGPVREVLRMRADDLPLAEGECALESLAWDFGPGGAAGVSRPVLVRLRPATELALPKTDPLSGALEAMKRAVAEQKKANGITANLRVTLSDARLAGDEDSHRDSLLIRQAAAQSAGDAAIGFFYEVPDSRVYTDRLYTLVKGEMALVMSAARALDLAGAGAEPALAGIQERQDYVLRELNALLGRLAGAASAWAATRAAAPEALLAPAEAADSGSALKDALGDFARFQERALRMSRSFLDRGGEDLSDAERDLLGKLAREEADWSKFFQEKQTDFSKLPRQDFADSSIAQELLEVIQEIQMAADALYRKNVEMAVPHEQGGLEKAEELIHNIERWLADAPDTIRWNMEEPPAPAEIPLADLPSELEDLVGELLDREDAMTEDVEDVSSSWMDSIDKGAGWDAVDGPISSMSAKGVTGNLLPNKQEIGGRSGEGRTGRSHGQMVEETAAGKDGRKTPSRLTPQPFEPGRVEDSSGKDEGGATGGGKLSGYAAAGLRGTPPSAAPGRLPRLAENQVRLRQDAEAANARLRAWRLPTGDIENSIAEMRKAEQSLQRRDGLGLRQAHARVLDALRESRDAIRNETGLRRERMNLPDWVRGEILGGGRDPVPRGFEQLVADYFKTLSQQEWPGVR